MQKEHAQKYSWLKFPVHTCEASQCIPTTVLPYVSDWCRTLSCIEQRKKFMLVEKLVSLSECICCSWANWSYADSWCFDVLCALWIGVRETRIRGFPCWEEGHTRQFLLPNKIIFIFKSSNWEDQHYRSNIAKLLFSSTVGIRFASDKASNELECT